MIKVICIKPTYYCPFAADKLESIKFGDIFEVTELKDGYNYSIDGDVKFSTDSLSDSFVTLAEWRELKIDEILND